METPGPRIYKETGPEALKEVLSRLFTARGWGRRQGRLAPGKGVGSRGGTGSGWTNARRRLRRGILEVEVNNGILLQELAQFQKRRLLEALRARLAGITITDLRFKAGTW